MQLVSWPNAVTIGAVVAIGVAVGGIDRFGDQRAWVPLAALFTLTAQGTGTVTYGLGYLTQVVIGAGVGLVTSAVVFPPLRLGHVQRAVRQMRQLLVDQLDRMVGVLDEPRTLARGRWSHELADPAPFREDMRQLQAQVRRAGRMNLRAYRWTSVRSDLLAFAGALERCSWLVEDVGLILREFEQGDDAFLGADLRHRVAVAFNALARLLEDPSQASPGGDRFRQAQTAITDLYEAVAESGFSSLDNRYLAGTVALTTQRCLQTFAKRHSNT